MKESNRLSRPRVNRCNIGTLVAIAEDTAKCQVIQSRCTSVLSTHNMINLMTKRRPRFRVETVFTPAIRTPKHFRADRFR
jgi:hypothetical protein